MLRTSIATIAGLLVLFALSRSAHAASIAVNFATDGSGANFDLATTDVTGVVPQGNWNNAHNSDPSLSNLMNSAGGATSVTVSWPHLPVSTTHQMTGTPIARMMHSAIDLSSNSSYLAEIKVGQIPYAKYDVYLYFTGPFGGEYTVSNLEFFAETFFYVVPGAGGDDLFHDATMDGSFGNYIHVTNLSGPNLYIHGVEDPGVVVPLSGFQIVDVPEPSSFLLGTLTVLPFAWRACRRPPRRLK